MKKGKLELQTTNNQEGNTYKGRIPQDEKDRRQQTILMRGINTTESPHWRRNQQIMTEYDGTQQKKKMRAPAKYMHSTKHYTTIMLPTVQKFYRFTYSRTTYIKYAKLTIHNWKFFNKSSFTVRLSCLDANHRTYCSFSPIIVRMITLRPSCR